MFKRFEIEAPINGSCPDFLSVYDGLSTAFPLTFDQKCGTVVEPFSLNTSSNHVTLRFVSDDSAVFRGFEVEYTEFSDRKYNNNNNNNYDDDNNNNYYYYNTDNLQIIFFKSDGLLNVFYTHHFLKFEYFPTPPPEHQLYDQTLFKIR